MVEELKYAQIRAFGSEDEPVEIPDAEDADKDNEDADEDGDDEEEKEEVEDNEETES